MAGNKLKMLKKILLWLPVVVALVLIFPFVWIPAVLIFMAVYLVLRFYELSVSIDSSYFDVGIDVMHGYFAFIMVGSLYSIVFGWVFWVILVDKVKALKHLLILQHELHQWVHLFLFVSTSTFTILLPRFILIILQEKYRQSRRDLIRLADSFVAACECAIFIAFEPVLFKQLRSEHHKSTSHRWEMIIRVLAFSLLFAALFSLMTRLVIHFLQQTAWLGKRKRVLYYAKGLRRSVFYFFVSILYMLVWVLYFEPHLREHHSHRSLDVVTWTFVCFAVGSFLWLIKKWIVLFYEARVVYDRFCEKINQAGIQLYYLSLLGNTLDSYNLKESIFDVPTHNVLSKVHGQIFRTVIQMPPQAPSQQTKASIDKYNRKNDQATNEKKKRKLAHDLLRELKHVDVTTYELQRMAKYFRHIDEAAPPNKNKIIESVFKTLEDPAKSSEAKNFIGVMELASLNSEDQEVDSQTLRQKIGSDQITQQITRWVGKADNNCRELGNILLGATEVTDYLNTLLMICCVVVTMTIWLLVAKIASIKLFVLILSPIAAASFIFGDTCKCIFQGIIFTFSMQLFHVGDVCVIDDTQLGVKRIGIWNTTFIQLDTNETVTYRNAALATKVITKYTGGLVLNDAVEYYIPIAEWKLDTFCRLKSEINQSIENSGELEKHPRGVLVKEVGEYVTIAIHFRHKAGLRDMIHSECHKKRIRAKAELLKTVKKVLDEN